MMSRCVLVCNMWTWSALRVNLHNQTCGKSLTDTLMKYRCRKYNLHNIFILYSVEIGFAFYVIYTMVFIVHRVLISLFKYFKTNNDLLKFLYNQKSATWYCCKTNICKQGKWSDYHYCPEKRLNRWKIKI